MGFGKDFNVSSGYFLGILTLAGIFVEVKELVVKK